MISPKKIFFYALLISLVIFSFALTLDVLAASPTPAPSPAASPASSPTVSPAPAPAGGASGSRLPTILPSCAASGRCTLCDLVQVAVNIGLYILAIVGAITLLFFIYGGGMMLISGGAPDKVKKGKDILINATIGLAIALLAYTVVTFVVSTVTKSGWDWQANLQCAPLPEPIRYTAPAAGSPTPKKGVGDACTGSSECDTALYCDHTGICQTKLNTGGACLGKTYEAKAFQDADALLKSIDLAAITFATFAIMPGPTVTAVVAAARLSNPACVSGDCNVVNLTGFGKCDAPAAGSGTAKAGEPCRRSNDCVSGHFCKGPLNGAGVCTKYLALGEMCDGLATDEDDRACGNSSSVSFCDDGTLSIGGTDICVPGLNVGAIDDPCSDKNQCRNNSTTTFCASDRGWPPTAPTTETAVGKCKLKLGLGEFCDGWAVSGGNDNDVCLSNKCDDGSGATQKCLAP